MDAVDYASQKEEFRPKWMPQVLKTIQEEASHNIAAQEFAAEMATRGVVAKKTESEVSTEMVGSAEAGVTGDKMKRVGE